MCVSMYRCSYRCVYIPPPPPPHAHMCMFRQTVLSVYRLQLWDREGVSFIPQPPVSRLSVNFAEGPLRTVVGLCLCVCPLHGVWIFSWFACKGVSKSLLCSYTALLGDWLAAEKSLRGVCRVCECVCAGGGSRVFM